MREIEPIVVSTEIGLEPAAAFERFVALRSWWPKPYTWSGDALVDLRIDTRPGGLLTELGPHGFRCDFGRVLAIDPPARLTFTWQISGKREPQPDPARASEVQVDFAPAGSGGSLITLTHRHFERHGGDTAAYRNAMASEQGWPYLLQVYRSLTA